MDIQKFEFTNYDVPVKFGDEVFTLDCSADTGDYLREMANEFGKISDEMKSGEKNTADAINYGLEAIDKLLGAGAAEKIFAGRKKTISDVLDVCMFLLAVDAKFQEMHKKPTK